MTGDRKPDFIERMQIADEEREFRRERRGALRMVVFAVLAMLLVGWGFMYVWVSMRTSFGRGGRERPPAQN